MVPRGRSDITMDLLGHVEVEAKFISSSTDESLSLTALIDTGATFTTLPASVSEKLRLPQITRGRISLKP